MLEDALRDVRPVERDAGRGRRAARGAGRAAAARTRSSAAAAGDLSGARGCCVEVATGRAYGVTARCLRARRASSRARARTRGPHPTVLLVGEIYVRSDPASNGWAADALERRGIRVRIEPVVEYLQYSEYVQLRRGLQQRDRRARSSAGSARLLVRRWCSARRRARWAGPATPPVKALVDAAAPYLREDLEHEAVLALGRGGPRAGARGEMDGVLCVGPLECMPNKLVEAQLVHVGRAGGARSRSRSR